MGDRTGVFGPVVYQPLQIGFNEVRQARLISLGTRVASPLIQASQPSGQRKRHFVGRAESNASTTPTLNAVAP